MPGKAYKISAAVAGAIFLLLLAGGVAVQIPSVQAAITRHLISKVEKSIKGDLSFSDLRILPSGALQVRDFLVKDLFPEPDPDTLRNHPPVDTLLYVQNLTATFTLKGLLKKEGIHLGRVTLDNAIFHVTDTPSVGYGSNIKSVLCSPDPPEIPRETGNIFDIKKLKGCNVRALVTLYKSKNNWDKPGIHVGNLDVMAPLVEGHALKFTKGRMHATLDRMNFTERCGLDIIDMTGSCIVGMGKTEVRDFHIVDATSDVTIPYYSMEYANTYAFRDFFNQVEMNLDLGKSIFSGQTLGIVSGIRQDTGILLDIESIKAHGKVCDLHLDEFKAKDRTSGIYTNLAASAKGLPGNIQGMTATAGIKELRFTTRQVSNLLKMLIPGNAPDLSSLAPDETMTFRGSASGPVNALSFKGNLQTESGLLDAEGALRNLIAEYKPVELEASVHAEGIDVSKFSGTEIIKGVTAGMEGSAVFKKGDLSASLGGLEIEHMEFNGYDYSGIHALGLLENNRFTGTIRSDDPNLKLQLRGFADIKPVSGRQGIRLSGNIEKADLSALNIDKRPDRSIISTRINANLGNFHGGRYDGTVRLRDIVLENGSGKHNPGDIIIDAYDDGDAQIFNLKSGFADASFYGTGSISSLIADIQDISTRKELPSLYKKSSSDGQSADYNVSLDIHDSRELLAYLKPGLYIAEGTEFLMTITDGDLSGQMKSPRLAIGRKYIKDAGLTFDNFDGRLHAGLSGKEIKLGAISFDAPDIKASADSNDLRLSVAYDGLSGSADDCRLRVRGKLFRESPDTLAVRLRPENSYISLGGDRWELSESDITLKKGATGINDFVLSNGDQRISLTGGISKTSKDRLSVGIENLDLGLIDRILGSSNSISGIAAGKAFIASPTQGELDMLMNFGCDSLSIGDVAIGSFKMASAWDEENKKLGISARNMLDGRASLNGHGAIYPADKKIEADMALDAFPMAAATPFLDKVFSEIGGGISGRLRAEGNLDSPLITSRDMTLDDVLLRVAFTDVPYTLNGPLTLTKESIRLDGIEITDGAGGNGRLTGSVSHDHLKDFTLNAGLDFSDLLFIDKEDSGEGVYGRLMASGNATAKGKFDVLNIDANVMTAGEGDIHIGLNGALNGGESSNLLTFVEQEKQLDPYDEMMHDAGIVKNAAMDLTAKARVNVTPGVSAFVEIDKANGNIISFNGAGSVNLDMRPSKDKFNLNGDYSINEGNYHFVLPGILEKDFIIQRGSAVNFSGDVMDSNLSIKAIHNLKTSLSTLITDSTAVASRRLVECGIDISGKLQNPQIGFSVNVPDLDPTTRSLVESALNTEDKVQKQFVSLLLIGSFLPSERSGVFNGTNMLYSNVTEIFSNQLNSILQKLEIPLDLGVDYQGVQSGTNIFDVAISTQLFNNRVVVNGSVGNRKYSTSTNPNGDMVGDLDIQIKLDQPGKVRLNLFSHSADEYTSYLDYSQRNGMGISYQKEFNTIGEFFRSIFMSKEKREKKAREALDRDNSDDVIIKIENEQR